MGKLNVDTGVITAEIEAGEIAALRKDAKRYRWIESQGLLKVAAMSTLHPGESRIYGDYTYRVPGTFGKLGAAIDAAMQGANT